MDWEEVEETLNQLTDPTTPRALGEALGYQGPNTVAQACREGRISGAYKVGGIWLVPLEAARQAIREGNLRPGWKQGEWEPPEPAEE
jgi:hypothetical protein